MLAWREIEIHKPGIYYRRSAGGEEVDFLIEHHTRLLPIEVKISRHLRAADARAVDAFCGEFGRRAPFGVVLRDGDDVSCEGVPHRVNLVFVSIQQVGYEIACGIEFTMYIVNGFAKHMDRAKQDSPAGPSGDNVVRLGPRAARAYGLPGTQIRLPCSPG